MPRAPRYEITGCPQYAAQIGHNSQPLFRNTVDFCVYRDALKDALSECDCDLHAFRFGDARVDLLVTQHSPGGVSRLMQHIGRRYAAYFNRTYFRTGTLYAGRYKSALVQPGRFAFACQRLIDSLADDERHPMSTRSSRNLATQGRVGDLLSPLDFYLLLGTTMSERGARYQAMLQTPMPASLEMRIRIELERNGVIGDDRFIDEMERFHQRQLRAGKPGRPRRTREKTRLGPPAGAHRPGDHDPGAPASQVKNACV